MMNCEKRNIESPVAVEEEQPAAAAVSMVEQ